MLYTRWACRRSLQLVFIPLILTLFLWHLEEVAVFADSQQNGFKKIITEEKSPGTDKEQGTQSDNKPLKDSSSGAAKSEDAKLTSNKNSSLKEIQEKKRRALQRLDEVLVNAVYIRPHEYSILSQVEGATLLWKFDNVRSLSILKDAVKAMKGFLQDSKNANIKDNPNEIRLRKIWLAIIRKIAAVNPDLIQKLLLEMNATESPKQVISGEWTDEARAVISIALEQIETDPALAARLAQQVIPLGYVDWTSFLERLQSRNRDEAEKLATILIGRLRDSSINALELRNLVRFILAPEQSLKLQDYFFQAVVIRLRREIRHDTTVRDLEDALSVARSMQIYAKTFPNWQAEFVTMRNEIEELFSARSLSPPSSRQVKMMDIPTISEVKPQDTQEIAEALKKIEIVKDSQTKDKEYQKLAARASLSADTRLAEDITSKIIDENIRQETTLLVYSPHVKKSIQESNWSQSQIYALKILEPLGRTLVLDSIAKAMSQAGEGNLRVMQVYRLAVTKLTHDNQTDKVAKALLLLAKSIIPLDLEEARGIVNQAVSIVDRLYKKEGVIEESPIASSVAGWVRLPNYSLKEDEVLDLANLMSSRIEEVARRDAAIASSIAVGLTHQGLRSLADLAICRALLKDVEKSPERQQRKTASK